MTALGNPLALLLLLAGNSAEARGVGAVRSPPSRASTGAERGRG